MFGFGRKELNSLVEMFYSTLPTKPRDLKGLFYGVWDKHTHEKKKGREGKEKWKEKREKEKRKGKRKRERKGEGRRAEEDRIPCQCHRLNLEVQKLELHARACLSYLRTGGERERRDSELRSLGAFIATTTFIRDIGTLLQIRQFTQRRSASCSMQGLGPTPMQPRPET